MAAGSSKKIINLSKHSFTKDSDQIDKRGRRFSNINTDAVIYNNEQLQQLYTGLYLDESLHNVGTYRWLSDSGSHKYEGKLFANNLHGYGKLVCSDDSLYEGLFYFNKKFGPGVITYDDKRQDVGLWNGNYLIRLCDKFSISDYYKENIPKLSGLLENKLYLLQFKHLIPISEKYRDYAKEILKKLGATDNVLANKSILYSKLVRNPKSTFINGEKLYKNFFTYEDELYTTIDVVDHFDEDGKPVIIKLEMCNLVAWNNEEINTVILKHAFLNRHYEKLLSFKVKDVLCAKKRGNFLPPGPVEEKSQELIFACRSSDPTPVRKLITEYDLYPDVADCRGNNTVTYATLANEPNIIKVLSEFGANLNSFNDDCVTPLLFAILQYIAIKYNITSTLWESAFIYAKTENDLPQCNQEWPKNSTISMSKKSNEGSQKSGDKLSATSKLSISQLDKEVFQNDEKVKDRRVSLISLLKNYILSLDCVRSKRAISMRKTIELETKPRSSEENCETESMYERFKVKELEKISKTISTLLLCGANPNIGEVPFCPIITSIFSRSKDLIQMLISFNAFVNVKTCEHLGKLGPLHVIGSLSPCLEQLEMAFIFLENGVHVDDFSNKRHWLEEQSVLLADKAPQDDLEKTPLHLVCMRYDFTDDTNDYLMKLAMLFVQYGANLNLKYLGHTPLTLAMMRGNIKLMENLLETGLVDPNEGLGYDMGVPLTMCVLNRYNKLLNSLMIKQLYSVLMQFYANPFNDVPNFNGNALEFYYCDQNMQPASKRFSINRSNNGSLLLNYAKTTLLKYIESKVVQTLYQYKIILDLDSSIYNAIVKFLNYKRTLNIIQILIDHNAILVNNLNLQKLLNFVDKKESNRKENFIKSDENYMKFDFDNYMPEVDPDELKYKVCFECFRKTNQLLLLCPKCEMVYFCSQDCNLRNAQNPNSGHPCKGTFYEDEKRNLNKKRSTKLDSLIRKTMQIQYFLSLANMNIEDFGKMSTKDKKQLKAKQEKQEKRKLDKKNKAASGDDKTSSAEESEADKNRKKLNITTSGDKKSEKSSQSQGSSKNKLKKSSLDGKDKKSENRSVVDKNDEEKLKQDTLKNTEYNSMKSLDRDSGNTKSDKTGKSRGRSRSKDSADSDYDEKSGKKKESKAGSKLSTSTDFGENKYNKVNLNLGQKGFKSASSVKHGLSILIGSKKPKIDIEKRNMYLKLRAQMLEKDRELNARKTATVQCVTEKLRMDKNCTERMLQLARQRIPNLPKVYEELDVKFWQIFSPYCIFQNGQLYYNFNEENTNVYYKITHTYSDV